MPASITFQYRYSFKDGVSKVFDIRLDSQSLALHSENPSDPPPWALLNHSKCSNCPLDEQTVAYCPIALNFSGIVREFKDFVSYANVSVAVVTEERTYSKETTIQQGLSPLLGIFMTTSGCPVMEPLKPMVRFHLPFATLMETIFRMVSMYFVAQYFLHQEGKAATWDLEGLRHIYSEVGKVNQGFAQRLRDAAKNDANVNALVNLDCFASMIPLAAEETLAEIRSYFAAYLK
ncbi:MAG TPA: hypothetical protein DCO77_01595 [Nitrospiraceae bacterium]|nr:hypothetical protein [Nitrospiraceae bacterium]